MRLGVSQTRPKWLLVGGGLAVVIATYLFLILTGAEGVTAEPGGNDSALIGLTGYLIGAALIIVGVAGQFTTSTYALIPIAIGINIIMGELVTRLKLPLYLDSIGTVLVGVLAGPWAGAATGGLANIIWGAFNPVAVPFAIVAIVIGLLAGAFTQIGWFRHQHLFPVAGLITGVVTAFLSAPLSAYIFGGVTGAGTDAVVALFRAEGMSVLGSSVAQGLTVDPLDKLVTFMLAYFIIAGLPPRMRARFSQSTTVTDKLPES